LRLFIKFSKSEKTFPKNSSPCQVHAGDKSPIPHCMKPWGGGKNVDEIGQLRIQVL
jgi:hypothetical protein